MGDFNRKVTVSSDGANAKTSLLFPMYIMGLGTAVPGTCYTQRQCWEFIKGSSRYAEMNARSQAIMRKVLTGASGIDQRHLALDRLEEAFELSPDVLHARFLRYAPALASTAALRAIHDSGVALSQIDGLLISTCTGYLCPGLTSYVAEALALSNSVLPLDFVGQGCAAALPNLMTAEALLGSGRCGHVLSICVEVCSAAFYLDDDPGVLISACLFGDGAGAAVLGRAPGKRGSIEWKGGHSLMKPNDRDYLRFEQKNGMLRNVLSPQVPGMAAALAREVLFNTLNFRRLSLGEINGWVFHPGGRNVLAAIAGALNLDPARLAASAGVLRRYGNLSSASVFFVLDAALNDSVPRGLWWMSSFGAGFSCHGGLLQVE